MFVKPEARREVYPLFALISSLIVFFCGLLLARESWFYIFLLVSLVPLVLFGYGRTALHIVPAFTLLGVVVGLLSLIFASRAQALQTTLRMVLLGVSVVPTISMAAINLVRVLNKLRCPRWLTLGLLIGLRFVPIMAQEIRRIRQAMRLRGVGNRWYHPRVIYRAFVIPLMMRIISISDLLALSLETRAFSMRGEATSYKTVSVGARDVAFLLLIVAQSALGLLLKFGGVR